MGLYYISFDLIGYQLDKFILLLSNLICIAFVLNYVVYFAYDEIKFALLY